MFCRRTSGRQGIKRSDETGRRQVPNFPRGGSSHARLLSATIACGTLGDSVPASSHGAQGGRCQFRKTGARLSNRSTPTGLNISWLARWRWPATDSCYTGDLDVLVRNSPDNAQRLEAALAEFGLAAFGLKASDFVDSYRVIQLGVPPYRIDLLTSLTGVTFEEAWTIETVNQQVEAKHSGMRAKADATRFRSLFLGKPSIMAALFPLIEKPQAGAERSSAANGQD
jgi:hypothetical protein